MLFVLVLYIYHIKTIICFRSRVYERGGRGDHDPGAHEGPIMGPVGFRGPSRGPIEMTLRNQYVEDRRLFFWEILRKRWHFSFKNFFCGDHIRIQTKLWHFPRLFWSSQNRRSVIFELTPVPRSALGAPVSNTLLSCVCA